jgi:hypothetical protein
MKLIVGACLAMVVGLSAGPVLGLAVVAYVLWVDAITLEASLRE